MSRTSDKRKAPSRPKPPRKSTEPITQVTLKMRASLHRELARKAFDSGMTMRGYVMHALQQAGLGITEADLVDRRKRDSSGPRPAPPSRKPASR